jgi:periplasmic divalent cation tolerance protein
MSDIRVLLSTTDSEAEAKRIAHDLVQQHLVACVNILSRVQSIYRWQGQIEETHEYLLIIKTRSDRVEQVISRITAIHNYDVPEVITLEVTSGSKPYLDWVYSEAGFES